MSNTKVLPTRKVPDLPATGEIGEFRQTSQPNPSQRNGMSPPAVPPSQILPPSQADYKG
jgi:hypothetical protein